MRSLTKKLDFSHRQGVIDCNILFQFQFDTFVHSWVKVSWQKDRQTDSKLILLPLKDQFLFEVRNPNISPDMDLKVWILNKFVENEMQ